MEKDTSLGGAIVLTDKIEIDTLHIGAEATGQDYTLGTDVTEATHAPVRGSYGPRLEPWEDQRFVIDDANHDKVRLALYGTIALNGWKGLAARATGKKRVARHILKAMDPREWQSDRNPPCRVV